MGRDERSYCVEIAHRSYCVERDERSYCVEIARQVVLRRVKEAIQKLQGGDSFIQLVQLKLMLCYLKKKYHRWNWALLVFYNSAFLLVLLPPIKS